MGKRTIKVYIDPDGAPIRVRCAVCKGKGTEWKKKYPPHPSRHWPADEKRIVKETAVMLKEAADNEWFRTISTDLAEENHREIFTSPDGNTDDTD